MTRITSVISLSGFLIFLALGLSMKVSAQRVVENPINGPVLNNRPLKVDKVVFSDTGTTIAFTLHQNPGRKFKIPIESFISIEDDTAKYFIRGVEGAQIGDSNIVPQNGTVKYRLYFPYIEDATRHHPSFIHFGENCPDGLQLYAIYTDDALLPFSKKINGNWYNKENGELAFVVRPDVIINYDQVYKFLPGKNKPGELRLQGVSAGKRTLFYKPLEDGTFQIGFSKDDQTIYTQDRASCTRNISKVGYAKPEIKIDSCTLGGYIWGYSKSQKEKVIAIFVDNVLTGNQDSYAADIQPDGRFEVKIPLYAPNHLIFRSAYSNNVVLMEPGQNLFVVLGDTSSLYLGPLASLNEEMDYLSRTVSYDFYDYMKLMKEGKPNVLKSYLRKQADKGYRQLDSINEKGLLSRKAYEIKKSIIDHNIIEQLLSYEINERIEYMIKHDGKANLDMPASLPDSTYYDFLKDSLVNNPEFLLFPGGSVCVNRIKYLQFLRTNGLNFSVAAFAPILKGKKVPLTKKEKDIVYNPSPYDQNIKDTAILNTYNRQVDKFINKYAFEARLYSEMDFRDSVLNTIDIHHGLLSDIMTLQDFAKTVEDELAPVDKETLIRLQRIFNNQGAADFIARLNNNVVAKIAANKTNGGYADRSNETIRADALWDSIIQQNKGNVLYIDFWETWCGPCRQAINKMVPIKKDFKGKPVKFVYIATHSSPVDRWQIFVPTIKGEHYRLSDEQANYLKEKFKIEGIPHVVIVDKTGNIVNDYYREISIERIKNKIESYL